MTLAPKITWIAFGASLLVALGGVSFITVTALERDRAEAEARQKAVVEENVRLALWRMDSALGALLAAENARPAADYRVLANPAEAPSPLLRATPPYVRLHFQLAGGASTSPQVPSPAARAAALAFTDEARLGSAEAALLELAPRLGDVQLEAALEARRRGGEAEPGGGAPGDGLEGAGQELEKQQAYSAPVQARKSTVEWSRRVQNVAKASNYNPDVQVQEERAALDDFEQRRAEERPNQRARDANLQQKEEDRRVRWPVVAEAVVPVWLGDALLLVRRVEQGGQSALQGAWVDWPALRASLLEDVRDLLPRAELVAVLDPAEGERTRRLASLPVRLDPGTSGEIGASDASSLGTTLVVAWVAVFAAVLAVAALLLGATALSERRATFVSAVTHELRTPLTTFRMYTEMLADGMVTDETKRARYLETLKGEAVRLGHLVENVLAYAKIERGRLAARPSAHALPELCERFAQRLQGRAEQAGMGLELELDERDPLVVAVDPGALEQILFNLVDNACKYARGAADPRIQLSAVGAGAKVRLEVRDFGPGITGPEKRSLFQAFSKSAQRAAVSAPGVGLGLALSRGLARAMGGELRYEAPADGGARFVLLLPRASLQPSGQRSRAAG